MSDNPTAEGRYSVWLSDGTQTIGYWLMRKQIWVTPDGAEWLNVIRWEPPLITVREAIERRNR